MLKSLLLVMFLLSSSFATVSSTMNKANRISEPKHSSNHDDIEDNATLIETNTTNNELNETFVQEANKVLNEVDDKLKEAVDVRSGYTTGLIQPTVGLYLTSLGNFDTKNGSFDVIFWSWFIYKESKNYKAEESVELSNAKDASVLQNFNAKVGDGRIWNSQKVRATVSHNWNFEKYPFDVQKLTIKFEDGDYDYRDLRFIADSKGSKVAKGLEVDGWIVRNFNIKEHKHVMDTDFGDPSLNNAQSVYSEVVVTIEIQRNWLREFINSFGPIYIAFVILALSHMFKDAYSEKLSLFLTSIFLLIGNKAIINDRMPASNVVTLVDNIQLFTFVIATIFIVILAISIALDTKGNKKLEYRINNISMYTLIPLYLIANIYMIQAAI